MITLCGRFLRSINFDYYPRTIAVHPDGKLLVSGHFGKRVQLMTPFGSLLQVWLLHAYTAHVLHLLLPSTALVHASLNVSLARTHKLTTETAPVRAHVIGAQACLVSLIAVPPVLSSLANQSVRLLSMRPPFSLVRFGR